MKYFVEFVVSSLVNHVDEVDVKEVKGEKGISYRVHLNPDDIGRVIGKKGKTISAIRSLLNSANAHKGEGEKKINVEIIDEKTSRKK